MNSQEGNSEMISKVELTDNLVNMKSQSSNNNQNILLNSNTSNTRENNLGKNVKFGSTFSEDKKRGVSRPKTAFSNNKNKEIILREDKVNPDLYFKVKDENEQLKKHQYQLNDHIKKLSAALEKVKHEVIVERRLSDRKVIHVDGGYDVETETLKMENDKLNDKVKKMQTIIKGMQTTTTLTPKSLGRKGLINAKSQLDNQSDKNEYLKMINHLRELLKQSENEVKRISAEMNQPNKMIKNVTDFNQDLRDKNYQVADLQGKYEKTQMQFETNIKILNHTKQSLEEYISKYNDERKKNLDLENRIQLMESNLSRMPEHLSLIEEYKNKEKHLEDRIKDLCENPFIKQAEERGNVYRKLQENELSLNEAMRRLKNLEETNKNLDKENRTLKEQFQIASIERDKYKEESMRFKISNEEKEKQSKNFEEQFKMLGQYGEVDSNFTKILNIMKLRDDNTSWMNIDFLEKMNDPENKDPVFLSKEIERLKIEKGMLGSELEKTRSLLQIQQQINEDQVKLSEEDKKILRMQNDKLMKRCEELAKLIDIERLPYRDRENMNNHNNKNQNNYNYINNLKRDLLGDLLPSDQAANFMSDAITEFSRDETETDFGLNENALDLYIGDAFFEEGLEKELGFKITNIMSFVSVDFYLHENQTSNLISGLRPIYNLQMSFKVVVDEHFIFFLESDYVMLDIYYIKDNVQALLGKGKVSLKELINIENYNPENQNGTRVINGICQLFYAKDSNLLIGSIHYKMRMRQPLLEIVKWYKERNQLIRELSPVQNVMMKKVEKEMIAVNNFTKGKVMSITILITKANGLKVTGAPRKISPYIYYQFYRFDEHFTDAQNGNDPLFQDVMKFDVLYDNSFHDYVEKETLDFYVLDNSRPLEVEMKQDENKTNSVNLIETPEYEDLIGVCKVPLRDLIINDLIQNSFKVFNSKGQVSGELVLNIFWEQSHFDEEGESISKNKLPYETKSWEDTLIIKLAELLKNKGLNLNSSFEIFDRDNKQTISLVNFKDTILFTFKFTSSQHELEELTELIFKGRINLTKLDFYKIFAMHLPHDGPVEGLIGKNTAVNLVKKIEENQIVENISINFGPDLNRERINEIGKNTGMINMSNTNVNFSQERDNNMSNNSNRSNANQNNINAPTFRNTLTNTIIPNLIPDSNRSMKEIVARLNEYMTKTGKSTPLEVYKMFDRDADLKDLANGFAKLGIPLSAFELERVWKDVTENNSRLDKLDYRLFKAFHERYDSKIKMNYTK